MTREEFVSWESASRDVIDVKRLYCDLAGSLRAGVVLSQIVFWHLPDKRGIPKLRVQKDGESWIAKNRADWWDECRISPKEADADLRRLVGAGLIRMQNSMFNGKRTPFIRICWDTFLEKLDFVVRKVSDIDQKGTSVSPNREHRSYRTRNTDIDQKGTPITETTAETTHRSRQSPLPKRSPKGGTLSSSPRNTRLDDISVPSPASSGVSKDVGERALDRAQRVSARIETPQERERRIEAKRKLLKEQERILIAQEAAG